MRFTLSPIPLIAVAITAGCASPHVVSVRQSGDDAMGCEQIREQYRAAQRYETDARGERGMTGTNVAAVVFFWPALIGTYMNTEDAIRAARDRQTMLADLATKRQCGSLAG